MPKINEVKQSAKEFRGYFNDVLNAHVRNTFDENDILMFVTYTPHELTLYHKDVSDKTYQLFNRCKYVEVLEQNFKKNKVYNYGKYIDGFHSHMLIKASDYKIIASQLKGYNIKAKLVYDLYNLINVYLTKQAGETSNRLPPTKHLPLHDIAPIPSQPIIETLKERIIRKAIEVLKTVFNFITAPICSIRTNKLNWNNMYLNDS